MLIKKWISNTPSRRFLQAISFIDKLKLKKKWFYSIKALKTQEYSLSGKKLKKGLRHIRHYPQILTFNAFFLRAANICSKIIYTTNKRKELSILKNIYNMETIIPSTTFLLPGQKYFFLFKHYLTYCFFLLISLFLPLRNIPLNIFFSYVQNKAFNKRTYACSSGVSCTRIYVIKTSKLEALILPSSEIKYFSKDTLCLLGKPVNLGLKFINFAKAKAPNKKKICTLVRGVAMNPVDHPNGGRTKAKQPEKTPWGKIAKLNK